jgi:ABC-type transport system involved in multi-copper enzyme maturation permease subunit
MADTVAVVERSVDYGYGSVRSRISWGAILAGAAVAMAIYALLMALGVAVGMSVSDQVERNTLGTSAGVWGFISLLIALFVGGWVTTQVTTGESRTEAVLYGVVLWATTSVLLIWITANGARAGIDAAQAVQSMTGGNQVSATAETEQTTEERQEAVERAREAGKEDSWWAFAGMLASMIAAIGGALVGPVELTVRRDTRHFRDPHTAVV